MDVYIFVIVLGHPLIVWCPWGYNSFLAAINSAFSSILWISLFQSWPSFFLLGPEETTLLMLHWSLVQAGLGGSKVRQLQKHLYSLLSRLFLETAEAQVSPSACSEGKRYAFCSPPEAGLTMDHGQPQGHNQQPQGHNQLPGNGVQGNSSSYRRLRLCRVKKPQTPELLKMF